MASWHFQAGGSSLEFHFLPAGSFRRLYSRPARPLLDSYDERCQHGSCPDYRVLHFNHHPIFVQQSQLECKTTQEPTPCSESAKSDRR